MGIFYYQRLIFTLIFYQYQRPQISGTNTKKAKKNISKEDKQFKPLKKRAIPQHRKLNSIDPNRVTTGQIMERLTGGDLVSMIRGVGIFTNMLNEIATNRKVKLIKLNQTLYISRRKAILAT